MLDRLEAAEGRFEVEFPFFIRKRVFVVGVTNLLDYEEGGRKFAARPPPSTHKQ